MMRSLRLRTTIVSAVIVWAVPLGSCRQATGVRFPAAVPMKPPPRYEVWWQVVEACSARPGRFADVRWYVVPGAREFRIGGTAYQGYWWREGNRIVLAEAAADDGELVRHEMLHALLKLSGNHTRADFIEHCGGIVACDSMCRAEAGGPLPDATNAPVVGPAALRVEALPIPATVSRSRFGGWMTITVSATNPLGEVVRVNVANDVGGAGMTWSYVISGSPTEGSSGGIEARDSLVTFGPGETQRYVFDVLVVEPSLHALAPGDYVAIGRFGEGSRLGGRTGQVSAPIGFTVVP